MLINEIFANEPDQSVVTKAERDAELGRTDFLRMLVAQLEHQDPLNPQDGTEFTAQLAQFSSLEQLVAMRTSIEDLTANFADGGPGAINDAVTADLIAAGLIGREVLAEASSFNLTGSDSQNGRFDAKRDTPPSLSFDLHGITSETSVRFYNESGARISDQDLSLGAQDPGSIDVPPERLAEFLDGQPAGNYTYEVIASLGNGDSAQSVASTRYTRGIVTGTSLIGDTPMLLVGGSLIPVSAVLEIREAASTPPRAAPAAASSVSPVAAAREAGIASGSDFARFRAELLGGGG